MKIWKRIGFSLLFHVIAYGVLAIVVRLHMTQQAYQFHEMKAYERSLKEEQLRLRSELAKALSPMRLRLDSYEEPHPDQVVKIP